MSAFTLAYHFGTQTTPPPAGKELRLNAAFSYGTATEMWIDNLTSGGSDVHTFLVAMPTATLVYLQDTNDHTKYARFVTTGAAIDAVTYVTLPIAWQETGLALMAQAIEALFVTSGSGPEPPSPRTPDLVTLARAKEELRITHAYEDAVITDKVNQATGIVAGYLDTKFDPLWDSTTVPLAVTAAILMVVEDLYVHRGADDWDQPTQTPYEHGYPAPRVRAVLAGLVKPLCV